MTAAFRSLRSQPWRLALQLAGLLAVAAGASALYQGVADARDRRRFPPPGRLVDIGGRRLHLLEAGEGSPTVVIVPALGSNVLEWIHVQRELADISRVTVYDRAGIGWSDPPPGDYRTFDDAAGDLHVLLHAAEVPPPYVLAGHSIGGIIVRRYAARFAAEVAGLVLIESSHEDQVRRRNASGWRSGKFGYIIPALRRRTRILGLRRLAVAVGLTRQLDVAVDREAPAEFRGAARAITLSSRQRRAVIREFMMLGSVHGREPTLGNVPLTVLSAPRHDDPIWMGMQAELAALSADSVHLVAPAGGHHLHLDDPALVVSTIGNLVKRTRR